MKEEIALYESRTKNTEKRDVDLRGTSTSKNGNDIEAMRLVASRVMVHWSKDEIGKTGWKTGKIMKMLEMCCVSVLSTKILGYHRMVV